MATIVWYGAGQNLRDHEKEFVEETGYPSAICDADKEKQGTQYAFEGGKTVDIISIEKAMCDFPDAEIWLTLAENHLEQVYQYLLCEKGIKKERIHFLGDIEYRLGCSELQNACYIAGNFVRTCCAQHFLKEFYYKNETVSESDVIEKLDEMEKWRLDTIEKLRGNKKTSCDGCQNLNYGLFQKKPMVNYIVVLADSNGCNCKCFYCNQYHSLKKSGDGMLNHYDYYRIAADYYKGIKWTTMVAGEPTMLKELNAVLDLVHESGWGMAFHTNGIVYSEKAAMTVSDNKASIINVSLDSGTRETYKRIKRVDMFDRVVANLHKYADTGCGIHLKYILLPEYNDNIDEVNAFINIAADIGVRKVILSWNQYDIDDGVWKNKNSVPCLTEYLFCIYTYMIARLGEEGLEWDIETTNFSKIDCERFERLH